MDPLVNMSFPSDFGFFMGICTSRDGRAIFTGWAIVYILCSPFFLLVLYFGFEKWKKQRYGNVSHSEAFTYNLMGLEMVAVTGSILSLISFYVEVPHIVEEIGTGLIVLNGFGQGFFHTFTCIDRYLAVVHPIVYLGLKKQPKVTYRNITIALVWLSCILNSVTIYQDDLYTTITGILLSSSSLVVIAHCTIAVLRALIRPKPGANTRPDRSKRVAFYTIVFILATLLVRLAAEIVLFVLNFLNVMGENKCFLPVMSLWFTLPSNLVLPLLFLHRAGAAKTLVTFA